MTKVVGLKRRHLRHATLITLITLKMHCYYHSNGTDRGGRVGEGYRYCPDG